MRRVHIHPALPDGPDMGNGGIGRVIKGQLAALPEFGWEYEPDPARADVIASHIQIPDQFLRLFPGKPHVVHNHGLYWHPDYAWGQEWTYDANKHALDSIRAADVTTAVSDWTAATLRRHTNRDIRVVTHGVDLDEWQPPADGARGSYVLWNKTRVDPICDPTPVARLAQRMPDVQFITTHLTGEDTFDNVIATGTRPFEEGKTYVRHAGVYLATTRETFGIGTLEALASGVPVVGYNWGGQAEFIEHGVDGWLVTPDDIEGLAEGVRWALENAAEIAPRARAKAEQFTERDAARAYAAIYDELADRYEARKEEPRTSVIVPAYNMGDYLRDTLNSVQAQTDQDWECIIVDDASPDPRDAAIAQSYVEADERFRYIRKEQNGYLAAARNTGIEEARGRFILPLDADDMIAPNTLQILGDALDGDRKTHIAYGGAYFVEEDGKTPHDYRHQQGPGYSGWPVPFELGRFFETEGQPMAYCSMYRREVWALTGGYRTRCRTSEDQDFWLRTTSYGFVPRQVTTAPLLIYRLRENSMSGTEGWANHRGWYPWVSQRSLLPAAAYRGDVASHLIQVPALDPVVVSVIIPVGPGHGQLVMDAVDSVDAQTFRNWECIVVNDSGEPLPNLPQWVRVIEQSPQWLKSTDGGTTWGTGDAVLEVDGQNVLNPPRFGGVAAARNAGIAASRGALFLPLDADDYLQPRALELMLQVHMDTLEDGERVSVYSDFFEDPITPGEFTVWETPDYDAHALHTKGLGYAVTVLTPKAWWEEVGGYDESLSGWEDWAFALSLAGKGHCSLRLPLPLFTYRKHTGMRREENMDEFDAGKADMMQKDFGADREGHLMACGSCRAAAQRGLGGPAAPGSGGLSASNEAVKLEYIGSRGGKQRVRGVRGPNGEPPQTYAFSDTRRTFYVQSWDGVHVAASGPFRRVEEASVPGVTREPVLVAAGAPPRLPDQIAAIAATPPVAIPTPPPPPAAATPIPAPTPSAEVAPAATPPPIQAAAAAAPVTEPAASTEPALSVPEGWVSEPEMQAMSRIQLNAYALSRGLEGAETMRTKGKVIEALAVKREMFG